MLNPLLQSPGLDPRQPLWVALLYKLRPLMMSLYFGADHVVWAQQVGGRGARGGGLTGASGGCCWVLPLCFRADHVVWVLQVGAAQPAR